MVARSSRRSSEFGGARLGSGGGIGPRRSPGRPAPAASRAVARRSAIAKARPRVTTTRSCRAGAGNPPAPAARRARSRLRRQSRYAGQAAPALHGIQHQALIIVDRPDPVGRQRPAQQRGGALVGQVLLQADQSRVPMMLGARHPAQLPGQPARANRHPFVAQQRRLQQARLLHGARADRQVDVDLVDVARALVGREQRAQLGQRLLQTARDAVAASRAAAARDTPAPPAPDRDSWRSGRARCAACPSSVVRFAAAPRRPPSAPRRGPRGGTAAGPSCSSSCWIWWLIADCDRCSSSAAREKLPRRAAASKPISNFREGTRCMEI